MDKGQIEQMDKFLEKERNRIISLAIKRKIITKEEWEKRFKFFTDEYGINSFIHYLEAIMLNVEGFATLNEKMIKNKKELEKRFKVEIIGPKEMKGMVKKAKAEERRKNVN